MTIDIHDVIIDRTPLEKAIRLETLRAELDKEGFTVVRTEWLRRLNVEILKRKLEVA